MSKLNLKVKITKSFEAEECTGEFFDVNDEIWKFYGVYRLSDKLYSFVEKIKQKSLFVFTKFECIRKDFNNNESLYSFHLDDDSKKLVVFDNKDIKKIELSSFKTIVSNILRDYIIVENIDGEREIISLYNTKHDNIEFRDSIGQKYKKVTLLNGNDTLLRLNDLVLANCEFETLNSTWVNNVFRIALMPNFQRVIRIKDMECSKSFKQIIPIANVSGTINMEYVWVKDDENNIAIMRISDFKVSNFHKKGSMLNDEFSSFIDDEYGDIVMRLSDFAETRIDKD